MPRPPRPPRAALCLWLAAALLALTGPAWARQAPAPGPLTGRLDTTAQGQPIVHLWGTARQQGHAHGALLRARIFDIVEGFALPHIGAAAYPVARALVPATAQISPATQAELQGMLDGLDAAGGRYSRALGRDLDLADLQVMQAYTELAAMGCSSVSTWGPTSADGSPRIVRTLDWSPDPALLRNQIVFVFHPATPTDQPVLSVGFAGYVGCLSCVNAAGVGAFFNMGYGEQAARPWDLWRGFTPANLLLRAALTRGDVDRDGDVDRHDVSAALQQARHAGSYIVHTLDGTGAVVAEVEADGVVLRTAADNTGLPATALAATNHLRRKTAPTACRRYARTQRALASRPRLDAEQLWQLGTSLALDSAVYTLQYAPRLGTLRLRLRQPGRPFADTPAHDWSLPALWPVPAAR